MTFHLLFLPSAVILGAMIVTAIQSINPFARVYPSTLEEIARIERERVVSE